MLKAQNPKLEARNNIKFPKTNVPNKTLGSRAFVLAI